MTTTRKLLLSSLLFAAAALQSGTPSPELVYTVSAAELVAGDARIRLGRADGGVFPEGVGEMELRAPLHLPDGARITALGVQSCTADRSSHISVRLTSSCDRCGPAPQPEIVGTLASAPAAAPGCDSVSTRVINAPPVSNRTRVYFVAVVFNEGSPAGVVLQAVRVSYVAGRSRPVRR